MVPGSSSQPARVVEYELVIVKFQVSKYTKTEHQFSDQLTVVSPSDLRLRR